MMNVLYFLKFIGYIYIAMLNLLQVINYRHNILQQCYSKADFLSEIFFLEKQRTIKEKLSF